jgi:hypothetical protein
VKEHSRVGIANAAARFGARIRAADAATQEDFDAFCAAFNKVQDEIIVPAMREVGEEIEKQGGARFAIEVQPGPGHEAPRVTLRLFLTPRAPAGHRITFAVVRRDPYKGPEVLAFLEASPPPMDIARYRPSDLDADTVEQILVDAVEQIYACVAELPGAR